MILYRLWFWLSPTIASRQRWKKKEQVEEKITSLQSKERLIEFIKPQTFGYILDRLSARQSLSFIRCSKLYYIEYHILEIFSLKVFFWRVLLIFPIKSIIPFYFILYLLGNVHSTFCLALKHYFLCDECHHSNLVLIFWVGNFMNWLNKCLIPQRQK